MLFKKRKKDAQPVAEVPQLEAELKRVNLRTRFLKLLRSTVYTLIVVAAVAVLIAVIFMPVLRIYGSSMNPTLNEGEIVLSVKNANIGHGDIVGVYYGSKVLVKRCIATEHEWVDIDANGNVYVNGELQEETYLKPEEKAFGECNLDLPYQVPDGCIFVMGDNRTDSIDSRNSSVGCIEKENIVGKIVFRVWPIPAFGVINKNG